MWIIKTILIVSIVLLVCHILGSNFKKWIKIRSDWNIHYGFIVLSAVFWIMSLPMQLFHVSWMVYFIIMTVFLVAFLGWQLVVYLKAIPQRKKFDARKVLPLIPVLIVIIVHLYINLGAWNPDNAYGDNLFYVAQSLQQINAGQIYLLEPSTGVAGNYLPGTYLFSSWELFISFLSYIFQLHTAIITSIAAQFIVIFVAYSAIYSLAYALFKNRAIAVWTTMFLFISILFSYNTTGKLEEYLLDGWFLFFAHVGKVVFKYVVIVAFFELLVLTFQRRKVIYQFGIQFVVVFTIYIFAGNAFSQLAFVNQFILLALFIALIACYRIGWKNLKYLFLAIVPSILSLGLFLFTTDMWQKVLKIIGLGNLFENTKSISTTTNVTVESGTNFSVLIEKWFGQISSFFGPFYWFVPFAFAIMVGILLAIIIIFISKRKQTVINNREQDTLIFFYLLFPLLFFIITLFNPWGMNILISGLIEFGYKRLLGNMMLNIFVITFAVWLVYTYFHLLLSKKWLRLWNVAMAIIILVFIFVPERLNMYAYSKSETRLNNRKYKSDTFDGQIDYQKLLENPYKLDQVTIDIGNFFADKPKGSILLIEYNMFYGPTYIRNYLTNVQVFNTRYSRYVDANKQQAYRRLNDFVTNQKIYDTVIDDLQQQQISYVIVKSDKSKVIDLLHENGYKTETEIAGYTIIRII